MRSIIIIAGGLLLLGTFVLAGRLLGGGSTRAMVTGRPGFSARMARRVAGQYVDRCLPGRVFGRGGVPDLPRNIPDPRDRCRADLVEALVG
jgi:hypothetical protein